MYTKLHISVGSGSQNIFFAFSFSTTSFRHNPFPVRSFFCPNSGHLSLSLSPTAVQKAINCIVARSHRSHPLALTCSSARAIFGLSNAAERTTKAETSCSHTSTHTHAWFCFFFVDFYSLRLALNFFAAIFQKQTATLRNKIVVAPFVTFSLFPPYNYN